MTVKNFIVTALFVLISLNYLKNVKAQDTFGPVCDDVTVTCVPTESPTAGPSPTPGGATLTPTPTETPTDTPSPTISELPRAGTTDKVNYFFVIALSLIFAGSIGYIAFSSAEA